MTAKKRSKKSASKKTPSKIKEDAPKTQESDNPRVQIGDNSEAAAKARADALKAAHEETYDLEKQEEALMDKHIKPLRERRSEIKSELKQNYEISAPQFNAWHGVYYFDREAEGGQDYISMQVIREQARACPVGGSLDLVDLAEKISEQRAAMAKADAAKKKTVENVEHEL